MSDSNKIFSDDFLANLQKRKEFEPPKNSQISPRADHPKKYIELLLNKEQVIELAREHLPVTTIARLLKCTPQHLYNHYKAEIEEGYGIEERELNDVTREMMHDKNQAIVLHLRRHWMGEHDKVEPVQQIPDKEIEFGVKVINTDES